MNWVYNTDSLIKNLTLSPLPTPLVLPYKGRWQRTKPFISRKGEQNLPLLVKEGFGERL
jgi:hypothetical protein